MSRNVIFVLINRRHTLVDLNYVKRFFLRLLYPDLLSQNLSTGMEENQRNFQTG